MNDFLSTIYERVLLYDGSKGFMLQKRGLKGEEASESWNLLKPDEVSNVYSLYKLAGSDVLQTNTFPGNRITLEGHGLGDKTYYINYEGVKLAKKVAGFDKYVAASVGPTGLFFEPAGDLTFDKAYSIFNEQLRGIEDAGADIVNFETFTDINELRAAILAAKENTKLLIIASATFNTGSKTLSGNPAEVCTIVCQSLGAAVVGANCSGGPESLIEPIKKMYSVASVPLSVKANAGMPELLNGMVVFKQEAEEFSSYTKEYLENGVRLIGGCCGTTPEYISAIKKEIDIIKVPDLKLKHSPTIASAYNYYVLYENYKYAVQRIRFKEHGLLDKFITGDFGEVIESIREYEAQSTDFLLIDFGDIDECFDMWRFMSDFNILIKKPVVIKSNSDKFLSTFLRYYSGKAGVILSDDTQISISQLKHYGALLLNDNLEPLNDLAI